MSEHVAPARHLRKTMTWRDGFAIALVIPTGPFVRGDWHVSNLTWSVNGGWLTVVVAFYITAWVTYGTEICASFAPEYRDTVRDTAKALRRTSLFMLGLFFVVPFGVGGSIGEQAIRSDPAAAFQHVLGGGGWIGVLLVVASLFLSMVSTTADGGRALYGLAQEGMTIKQLDWVNRWVSPDARSRSTRCSTS